MASNRWIVTGYQYCFHNSPEVAEAEAERLREKYPDRKFRVLRVKTTVHPYDPPCPHCGGRGTVEVEEGGG